MPPRAVPAPELADLAAGDGTGTGCPLFCRRLRGVGSIALSTPGRPARLPWSRRYQEFLTQGREGQGCDVSCTGDRGIPVLPIPTAE